MHDWSLAFDGMGFRLDLLSHMTAIMNGVSKPTSPLYFLHIPKTAGTSLRYWLDDLFADGDWLPCHTLQELTAVDRDRIKQYRFFSGHFSFSLYDFLKERPLTVTWLREPVAREISHYNYNRDRFDELISLAKNDGRRKWIDHLHRTRDMSLTELCQSSCYLGFSDNMQVRHLSGAFPAGRRVKCDERMLQQAKHNLMQLFHFGICELMNPAVDLLSYRLACPRRQLRFHFNATEKTNCPKHSLSTQDLNLVRHVNRFDLQLYEFAKQQFLRRFASFWMKFDPDAAGSCPPQILEQYACPSTQQRLDEFLKQHFQNRHTETAPRVTHAHVDFSDSVIQTGWYPRSKSECGGTLRWAGPENTSSIFVPLKPNTGYRINFVVRHAASFEIWRKMKLRVGAQTMRLRHQKHNTDRGNIEVQMSGVIPPSAVDNVNPFTEIVFETVGTREQLVDYDRGRRVSFATDRFEITPAGKAA